MRGFEAAKSSVNSQIQMGLFNKGRKIALIFMYTRKLYARRKSDEKGRKNEVKDPRVTMTRAVMSVSRKRRIKAKD